MSAIVVDPAGARSSLMARARWIDRPITDIAVAFSWLPVALLQHSFESDPHKVKTLLGLAFLVSFLHQPLTLGLVYGDKVVFNARRAMYTWTPLVAVAAVLIGLNVSLALVAVVAGVWNAQHTLMQRYGLTRIYGRKAGDDNGRVEKWMYMTWLAAAMVWVAADKRTPGLVEKADLGEVNRKGVQIMQDLRPVALWLVAPLAVAAVVLAVKWLRAERALGLRANPAKHVYVAGTAALIIAIVIDPLAGFTAYVATHAVEYFVTVHRSLRNRPADESAVAAATSTRSRRTGVYVAYFAVVGAFSWACLHYEWFGAYRMAVMVFGALHIFYDGFIWKLRRPRVASTLGLA
ncbi:MAG: hypothetical protein AB7N61_26670 [Acidimicrobiia bacterium]